jgi:transposase
MPQNFLSPQRDQPFLLPVDMREWLPEDDLAFIVLDAVAALDLGEFRRRYRADGHGRAAFDPEMMVALLLYGYCQGERSSGVIEKRCGRDVGYRVITSGMCPDHATIARLRARPEQALDRLRGAVQDSRPVPVARLAGQARQTVDVVGHGAVVAVAAVDPQGCLEHGPGAVRLPFGGSTAPRFNITTGSWSPICCAPCAAASR